LLSPLSPEDELELPFDDDELEELLLLLELLEALALELDGDALLLNEATLFDNVLDDTIVEEDALGEEGG